MKSDKDKNRNYIAISIIIAIFPVVVGIAMTAPGNFHHVSISEGELGKSRREKITPVEYISEDVSEDMREEDLFTPEWVPDSLVAFLGETFLAGNAKEVYQDMVIDVEIPPEELEQYLQDPQVAALGERMEQSNGGMFLRADIDNDGIEDLFAWIWDGGTMGNSNRCILKGSADGGYHYTEEMEGLTRELAFVEYEGKNYLLETSFDYDKKAVDGFIVTCYVEGRTKEWVSVIAENTAFEPEIVTVRKGLENQAAYWEEVLWDWLSVEHSVYFKDKWIVGSGETAEEENGSKRYRADIDNDGTEELYQKSIFYPSNYYTQAHLTNNFYIDAETEERYDLLDYYGLEYEGTALYFWVDEVALDGENKNLLCLLTYDGLSVNRLYGYLIEEGVSSLAMEITYHGVQEIQVNRSTERRGCFGRKEDIFHIGQLSHLKYLQLSVNDDETDLSSIGSLAGLKQLTLNSYGDDPSDLSFLKNLKELTEVFVDKWCDIEDLSYFQDMPRLQSLSISYVGDVDLYCLSELKNLETLQITGAHIRNIDGLENLINLKQLSLSDNSADAMYGETEPLNLQPLANLTQLEWIELEYIHLNDITPLASLKGLRHIYLANTKVEDILPLADLENLDALYLFGNHSELIKEQAETCFSKLEKVEIDGMKDDDFLFYKYK